MAAAATAIVGAMHVCTTNRIQRARHRQESTQFCEVESTSLQ